MLVLWWSLLLVGLKCVERFTVSTVSGLTHSGGGFLEEHLCIFHLTPIASYCQTQCLEFCPESFILCHQTEVSLASCSPLNPVWRTPNGLWLPSNHSSISAYSFNVTEMFVCRGSPISAESFWSSVKVITGFLVTSLTKVYLTLVLLYTCPDLCLATKCYCQGLQRDPWMSWFVLTSSVNCETLHRSVPICFATGGF